MGPRELRALVPVEVAAVLAVAIVPLPETMPFALPLIVVAALALWIRGRSFTSSGSAQHHPLIGAVAGLAALGLALVGGTPLVEAVVDRGVQWSTFPIVRGNPSSALMVMLVVATSAVAAEAALRGWVVERVLELAPAASRTNVIAVAVGGVAEALVTPGDLVARIGAGLFGLGLGWMYVAGGRSLAAPVCARLGFQVGAVGLEALRIIG